MRQKGKSFRPLCATQQQAQSTLCYATVGSVALATSSLPTLCYTTAGSGHFALVCNSWHILTFYSHVAFTCTHHHNVNHVCNLISRNTRTTATLASLTLNLLWGGYWGDSSLTIICPSWPFLIQQVRSQEAKIIPRPMTSTPSSCSCTSLLLATFIALTPPVSSEEDWEPSCPWSLFLHASKTSPRWTIMNRFRHSLWSRPY